MHQFVLAMLLAAAPHTGPVPPRALIKSHADRMALVVATMQQCQKLPSPLACLHYERNVYALANATQRSGLGQILAPQASFLGRYRDAARYDPLTHVHTTERGTTRLPPSTDHAVDAVQAIARLAHKRQLVMINEFHMDASTRALTIALLPRLYAQGFRYLAVEALSGKDPGLQKRGYAIKGTGYYTREPLLAEMLARAVRLGYTLVPYDVHAATQQQREDAQARNIYRKIFKHHPHARVLVHAGIAHIGEQPGGFPGKVQPMAMRLGALTGIDPLTIDQTTLRAHTDSPLRRALATRYRPSRPAVIEDARGRPWSAYPGRYDITVLMPDSTRDSKRPRWLGLYGSRRPVTVRAAWCKGHFPCEILARPASRMNDAVPSDCYALFGKTSRVSLYLSPGRYRVMAYDSDGRTLSSRLLTVSGEHHP